MKEERLRVADSLQQKCNYAKQIKTGAVHSAIAIFIPRWHYFNLLLREDTLSETFREKFISFFPRVVSFLTGRVNHIHWRYTSLKLPVVLQLFPLKL